MKSLEERVRQAAQDHLDLAAQYEAGRLPGDAAKLRTVSNLLFALIAGREVGTILPAYNAGPRKPRPAPTRIERQDAIQMLRDWAEDESDNERLGRIISDLPELSDLKPIQVYQQGYEDTENGVYICGDWVPNYKPDPEPQPLTLNPLGSNAIPAATEGGVDDLDR